MALERWAVVLSLVELDSIVGRDDGKIPRKYRELIALAVACTTQCPYCLGGPLGCRFVAQRFAYQKGGCSRERTSDKTSSRSRTRRA
ncbi:MAG TPA: carboxymuconolactone decarboxylase family protein [Methylomirabilota bacterium]|nr:carboxymuconolactone decarboxylase family protein [Methylomirabilota bacterium]